MKIVIKDDLLWKDNTKTTGNIINCIEGDKIANANGFMFVERLVKAYSDNTKLTLDENFKIISTTEKVKCQNKIQ